MSDKKKHSRAKKGGAKPSAAASSAATPAASAEASPDTSVAASSGPLTPEGDPAQAGGEKPVGEPIAVPISAPSDGNGGSVASGPAPTFEAPDVYAPEVPDHAPGTAPAVEAGHPGQRSRPAGVAPTAA